MKYIDLIEASDLAVSQLIKHGGWRMDYFLEKVRKGLPFPLKSGSIKEDGIKEIIIDKNQYPELESYFNKIKNNEKVNPIKIRAENTNRTFVLGDLQKTSDFRKQGGTEIFNLGNLAEAILATAISLKFLNGIETSINEKDLIDAFNNMNSNTNGFYHSYTSVGKNKTKRGISGFEKTNQNRKINLIIGLSEIDMKYLLENPNRKEFLGLIRSSVLYSNKNNNIENIIKSLPKDTINNIKIKAIGLDDQKGTKADILTLVNDQPIDLNISLKTQKGKQFGQKVGMNKAQVSAFFKELVNVDLPDYILNMFNENPKKATVEAYEYVARLLKQELAGKDTKNETLFVEELAKGIKRFATRDEDIILVSLKDTPNAAGYAQLEFSKLYDKMKEVDLDVEFISSGKESGSVRFIIYDKNQGKDKGKLIQVRLNVQYANTPQEVGRNIIEAGPLLKELASTESYQADKKEFS